MEITYDVAQSMMRKRLDEYPPSKEVVVNRRFKQTLQEILEFEGVDPALLARIEFEVMLVITFFVPLHQLSKNISQSTGLSQEKASHVATLIEALLLDNIQRELDAFDQKWKEEEETFVPSGTNVYEKYTPAQPASPLPEAPKEVRERLDLRPSELPPTVNGMQARPLTREDVLRAITPKRTMQSDIDQVRQDREGPNGTT